MAEVQDRHREAAEKQLGKRPFRQEPCDCCGHHWDREHKKIAQALANFEAETIEAAATALSERAERLRARRDFRLQAAGVERAAAWIRSCKWRHTPGKPGEDGGA